MFVGENGTETGKLKRHREYVRGHSDCNEGSFIARIGFVYHTIVPYDRKGDTCSYSGFCCQARVVTMVRYRSWQSGFHVWHGQLASCSTLVSDTAEQAKTAISRMEHVEGPCKV